LHLEVLKAQDVLAVRQSKQGSRSRPLMYRVNRSQSSAAERHRCGGLTHAHIDVRHQADREIFMDHPVDKERRAEGPPDRQGGS